MDKKSIYILVAGVVGAAVGSLVTYKVAKTKFEKLANEEFEKAREKKSVEKELKPDLKELAKNYVDYSNFEEEPVKETFVDEPEEEEEEEVEMIHHNIFDDLPYVIDMHEVGELPDYDVHTLWYFVDGVLTDDQYNRLDDEDIDKYLGDDWRDPILTENSVYVRNDARKSDYEILVDLRTYTEMVDEKPYLVD